MENANRPINPAISEKINDTEFFEYNLPHGQRQHSGLTKREYFAGIALSGLLSSNNGQTVNYLSQTAVKAADELLKALEK